MKVVGLYLSHNYPVDGTGTIHINGYHFANWYRNKPDMGEIANKYTLNRTGLALRMNLPMVDAFNNLGDMLDWLNAELPLVELPSDIRENP